MPETPERTTLYRFYDSNDCLLYVGISNEREGANDRVTVRSPTTAELLVLQIPEEVPVMRTFRQLLTRDGRALRFGSSSSPATSASASSAQRSPRNTRTAGRVTARPVQPASSSSLIFNPSLTREEVSMTTVIPEQAVASVTDATTPRTWTFTDRRTGQPFAYTCMTGCTLDHTREAGDPVFREDVWCWSWDESVTLPVNENGSPEEFRVLSTVIKVEPWSRKVAERLPFAVVELVDDHFIDGLDPDGLETVINALAARVERMRATHERLVEIRAEYRARVDLQHG